jgi:hypothetical protein
MDQELREKLKNTKMEVHSLKEYKALVKKFDELCIRINREVTTEEFYNRNNLKYIYINQKLSTSWCNSYSHFTRETPNMKEITINLK